MNIPPPEEIPAETSAFEQDPNAFFATIVNDLNSAILRVTQDPDTLEMYRFAVARKLVGDVIFDWEYSEEETAKINAISTLMVSSLGKETLGPITHLALASKYLKLRKEFGEIVIPKEYQQALKTIVTIDVPLKFFTTGLKAAFIPLFSSLNLPPDTWQLASLAWVGSVIALTVQEMFTIDDFTVGGFSMESDVARLALGNKLGSILSKIAEVVTYSTLILASLATDSKVVDNITASTLMAQFIINSLALTGNNIDLKNLQTPEFQNKLQRLVSQLKLFK